MRPEIAARIAQIRRGEVPRGYQRTKAGIIPDDWKEISVGACIREYKRLSNDVASVPVYSSSRRGLVPQSEYYDRKEASETNLGYKVVPPGYATYRHMSDDDIFHFNVNETGGEILVSAEYPVFAASEICHLGFLIPALNETRRFRYFCRTQKLGGTRTRLYLSNLVKYRVPLPPPEEQRRIADVLSAQDDVIALKERLIAEKTRQKRGLMQDLFHRFQGPRRKIADVCAIVNGGTPDTTKAEYWNGDILWCAPSDFAACPSKYISSTEKRISKLGLQSSSATMLPAGTVLLCSRATVGEVRIASREMCTNQGFKSLIAKPGISNEWLYYTAQFIRNDIMKLAYGSTFLEISKSNLANIEVSAPPYEVQVKITEILSAADREIELLRRSLELERRQKTALAQLLLTGLVRLS